MYKVIHDFIDKDGISYYVGDNYPFFTTKVDEKHIEYLSGTENKIGEPLIEKIKNEMEDVVVDDENTSDSEE